MKYRKKPVKVEAFCLKDLSYKSVMAALAFMGQPVKIPRTPTINHFDDYMTTVWKDNGLKITTLEGTMLAGEGDYIIKGVQGEFYPCKPDIFEQTYEPVGVASATVDVEISRDKIAEAVMKGINESMRSSSRRYGR